MKGDMSKYDLGNMDSAYKAFVESYPTYETTAVLDELRDSEYGRLDKTKQIYLDYTGGGLYADKQLRQHMEMLRNNVYGNPHSQNPTSSAATSKVEAARAYVLEYFNASPDEYTLIFTANASGALKLVGESYPFTTESRYALTFDNHNSVNGIREFAKSRGTAVDYIPLKMPELRIDREKLDALLDQADPEQDNLFAYPAQSNFTGVQHPLELIAEAKAKGWDVLLDGAAFAPTSKLDLSVWKPDFVSLSFYKMFGYPTGLGCLIARNEILAKLRRPWFAGGTIVLASVQAGQHYLASGEAAFEDGTVDYLNIPAVEIGLRHLSSIGIETIHERVHCLTGWILDNLFEMKHENGRPLVRIYGPVHVEMRGGTVTFNLYDKDGRLFNFNRVDELAGKEGISLRTGCFCNPGAGEIAEGLTADELADGFSQQLSFPQFISMIEHKSGKSAGAIRSSVGIATNFTDVYRFMAFIHSFLNKSNDKIGAVEFDIQTCRVIRDGS